MQHQKTDLAEYELCGWEEIREAMEYVEELRGKSIDARIEVMDEDCNSCTRVILHSFDELQEFISYRFSRLLVSGITTSIPLDDFERLITEVSTRLLGDSRRVIGRLFVKSKS